MEKLIPPGRVIFATGMLALGLFGFLFQDFIVGRPPAWPEGWMLNPALAYLSGTLLIASSLAILFRKNAGLAALVIAGLIFLLSVLRHLPQFMHDWANAYKSMALFGGALIVAASFFRENNVLWPGRLVSDRFIRGLILTGYVLLAAFFLVAGYAHFKYSDFVNTLIPDFIPFHPFWTYFCGICLLAGGLGLLLPPTRKWAALLSGIMVLGWFLLLHIPRFLADPSNVSDRLGLCESFTFVGIFFVLAGLLVTRPAR